MRKGFFRSLLKMMPLIFFPKINALLLRLLGYNISYSARIYSSVKIFGNIKVEIGENTFIGNETIITGGLAAIQIGNNCDISDRVSIFCGTHEIDYTGDRSAGKGIGKDIVIEDGVWIGYGALVLPGVRIGKKSVVAAGTVVHKNVPPYTIVGGNPMKILKHMRSE